MIIKKWNTSTTAWESLSPKVTYTDIVADVTAGSPTSIFSSGKLLESYLPNSVFGGMKFVGTVGYNSNALDSLEKLIQGGSTNWTISSSLDSFTSKSYSNGDYAGIGQQYVGYYWVVQNNITLGVSDSAGGAADFADEATDDGDDQLGSSPYTISVEHGDWLIITGWDNTNSKFLISVINNTYKTASSGSQGIMAIGYTENGKNYPVELDGNSKAFVNVPWVDTNTFRTVTAGGNTLGASETLAFTEGSNISISESAGAVTIAATNTTYSAGSGIGITGTTFSVAAGNGLTQETNGLAHADTSSQASSNNSGRTYIQSISIDTYGHITSMSTATETVTDTTYSAGNGISLSGTTFSVAGGQGLSQESSGLAMTYPVYHGDTLPTLTSSSIYSNVIGFEW